MYPSDNNSFGGSPITSSSNDPIVIGGASEKKKPAAWVFVLIGIVVVGIIALVLVLLFGPKGKVTEISVEENTNKYLNLLFVGEDKEEALASDKMTLAAVTNEGLENIYTIPRFYGSLDEKNTNYYKTLQDLLDGIAKKSSDENVDFWVEDSKTMLSYYFVATALAYTNSDYNHFMTDKVFDGFLTVYGYPFEETSDSILRAFKTKSDALYDTKKEFYKMVAQTNCLMTDGIDYVCLNNLNSSAINAVQQRISSLTASETIESGKMLEIIVADAKSLNNTINGNADE